MAEHLDAGTGPGALIRAAEREADPAQAPPLRTAWRDLAPHLAGERGSLLAVGALGLAGSLLDGVGIGLVVVLLYALLSGEADGLGEDGLFGDALAAVLAHIDGQLIWLSALVVALYAARVGLEVAHGLLASRVEHRVNDRVRRLAFASLLHRPFAQVAGLDRGEVLAVFDRHIYAVSEALDGWYQLTVAALSVLVLGALTALVSPVVALAALAGTSVFLWASGRLQAATARLSVRSARALARTGGALQLALDAGRTIRLFGRTGWLTDRFARRSAEQAAADQAIERRETWIAPLAELYTLLFVGAVVATVLAGWLPALSTLAALALLSRLQPYLSEVEASRLALAQAAVPLAVAADFLRPVPPPTPGPIAGGGVRLTRVCFAFGDETVLSGASAQLPARGWTVLEGPSGAGKSTLVNLIAGLRAPDAGAVRIDPPPTGSPRGPIAVAGQDVELFAASVRDNLRMGRPADDATVWAALRVADAVELVESWPGGLDTRLGDRALDLSGGQRQRLGLARAILIHPALLCLDEATSAIEPDGEARILANLRKIMVDGAVLIVSHHSRVGRPGDHRLTLAGGQMEVGTVD